MTGENVKLEEAAKALGAKVSEVVLVDDSPAGTVAVTFDGTSYLIVDGEVSYLAVPDGVTAPAIPVYEQPTGDDERTGGDLPSKVADVLEWVGYDGERAEVALEQEESGQNRPTLVAALTDLIIGAE